MRVSELNFNYSFLNIRVFFDDFFNCYFDKLVLEDQFLEKNGILCVMNTEPFGSIKIRIFA